MISILVNGSPNDEFEVVRGLRQGYPLSLFIFNIVAEGLSMMFIEVVRKRLFGGFELEKGK